MQNINGNVKYTYYASQGAGLLSTIAMGAISQHWKMGPVSPCMIGDSENSILYAVLNQAIFGIVAFGLYLGLSEFIIKQKRDEGKKMDKTIEYVSYIHFGSILLYVLFPLLLNKVVKKYGQASIGIQVLTLSGCLAFLYLKDDSHFESESDRGKKS